MRNYTIIHLHSDLSNGTTNIDSVTKFDDYINKAVELNMKAIAFTEHGNMFNWVKKKITCDNVGIKYIHGVEAYITETLNEKIRDNYHVCLYAKNYDGIKELNKLISNASNRNDGHFYYVPRITFDELTQTSQNIIISTACLASILGSANTELKKKYIQFLSENNNRCFLEIQHHNVKDQIEYNKYLYELSQKYNIPLITGTDTHSLNAEHAEGRIILQKAKNIYFDNEEGWDLTLKTYEELINSYKIQNSLPMDVVENAIDNTNKLADMIDEFTLDTTNKYPRLWNNPEKIFINKIKEGYKIRGIDKKTAQEQEIYKKRIKEEFEVYKQTDAIDYMLFMKDVIDYAHKNDMWQGCGRGSVNGSIIAYLLQVTDMDSIKFNLNFFRFLNPNRISLCDIDTDWSNTDRDKIKEYLFNYKGIYASEIITFNTIALKGAIRDIGRALKIPLSEVDNITKNIEVNEGIYREKYPALFKYVDIVNGVIVSIGTHPSGILISPLPIDEYVGICTLSTTQNSVSMLNMKELDYLNFVKFDILGLDNVDIINTTCKLARIDRLTPDNINLDDEEVWKDIKNDTTAIFQWESTTAQDYIRKLFSENTLQKIKEKNPNINYIDLFSFGNGAIRPSGESYRDLAANGEFADNGLKELNDFLSSTMGYLTYQEQIMMFLVNFCGYSMAESDTVRRAIGKKLGTEDLIPEIEQRFIEYSTKKFNISKERAGKIVKPFIQVILSASSYGFSLNHSTPYSIIGYMCGWLRYYYPLEFLTSALNVYKDNMDKIIKLTAYANKRDIQIKPVKFRYSKGDYFFDKQTNTIYKGVGSIKFLNNTIGEELYNLRDKHYNSFIDLLIDLTENTSINTRQTEILIKLNYFEEFGNNGKLYNIFNEFINGEHKYKKTYADKTKQKRIAELKEIEKNMENTKLPIKEQIEFEKEILGYPTSTYKLPKSYLYILDTDVKYSPKVVCYCLANGKSEVMKIPKQYYNKHKIKQGDIIIASKFKKKPKLKKTETGFEPIEGEFDWWIEEYSKKELK